MVSESRTYNITLFRAYKHALNTITELGWQIEHEDTKKHTIVAKTPMSLFSWEERIEVIISQRHGEIVVRVSSDPSFQFFDWGKSKNNLRLFFNAFNKGL